MTRKLLASSTALALVGSAHGAWAAVTPEEVWANWQAFATASGQELTIGGTARNGDTLEVSGVVLTYTDDLGGSFSAEIEKMNFKDNGDGTVAVTMSESYPMTLAFPATEDGPSSMALTVTQPGLVITAGGSADATRYDFDAPMVAVTLNEVKDESGAPLDTKGTVALSQVAGSYLVTTAGEATALDSSFSAQSLALDLSGSGSDGGGQGAVTFGLTDLKGATKGNYLGAEVMANLATALNSGFTTDSTFSFGGMSILADVTDASGPVKFSGSATGGDFTLAMDKARVNYGTGLKGASFTVSGAEIPFPEVVFGFSEFAFNVLVPASKSEEPQDFAFLSKLVDFTVSDEVWGLFDPAGTLSRDPATVIVDTRGTGRWLQDIMDPAVQVDGVEPPGELNSLDLTQLLLRAAGAEVSATGGLTFDNTDLVTFQGMPAPSGQINVTIKGINALIDNLISMGLLPDDQAMGFRMMLGVFTRPGSAPDEVTSLIEFKDGGLFANGQQLQ
jgi:hypothetical protein